MLEFNSIFQMFKSPYNHNKYSTKDDLKIDDKLNGENISVTIEELTYILNKNGYDIKDYELIKEMHKDGFLRQYKGFSCYPSQNMIDKNYLGILHDEIGGHDVYRLYATSKGKNYLIRYYLNKITHKNNKNNKSIYERIEK